MAIGNAISSQLRQIISTLLIQIKYPQIYLIYRLPEVLIALFRSQNSNFISSAVVLR